MTENPKPQRFQFTLRRMLLWTAVVAVWCGVFTMIRIGFWLSDFQSTTHVVLSNIIIISWVAIIGIARAAFRARAAAAMSIVTGVIWAVWVFYRVSGGRLGEWAWSNPVRAAIALIGFSVLGVGVFIGVEASFRMVHWIDCLMESKLGNRRRDIGDVETRL